MARRLFIFDDPDRFLAGTVGAPGARSFYLQARKGGALISVGVEKTQVAVLADRLAQMLETIEPPPMKTGTAHGPGSLEEPITESFRVGAMALAWDPARGSVVVEAQPLGEDGAYREVADDDPEGPDLLRVLISAEEARRFVDHSLALVASGRPPCPFCGAPLEATGHFCTQAGGRLN